MNIEKKIISTIKNYKLIRKSDKVVVALSGGKDSTTTLYFLKKLGYDVSGLMIHLCMGEWSEKHRKNMFRFCKELGVPLTVVNFKEEIGHEICYIKDILKEKKNLSGSTVCGIMKRYILNKYAKELHADVIATGHNLDDEVQNILMNYLKGNILLGINSSPMTGGKKVAGFVPRIKPLFFVPEEEVRTFTKKNKFAISYEQCPCSYETYRAETREWIESGVMSDSVKLKLVMEFLDKIPGLKKQLDRDLSACVKCGEPTSGELCSACGLFVLLKE